MCQWSSGQIRLEWQLAGESGTLRNCGGMPVQLECLTLFFHKGTLLTISHAKVEPFAFHMTEKAVARITFWCSLCAYTHTHTHFPRQPLHVNFIRMKTLRGITKIQHGLHGRPNSRAATSFSRLAAFETPQTERARDSSPCSYWTFAVCALKHTIHSAATTKRGEGKKGTKNVHLCTCELSGCGNVLLSAEKEACFCFVLF